MMMSRHDPDLMVSLVYYLAASNPVGAWTVGFLAYIGTLSLARQPHRHPIWYCGLGILVALSALYFVTIILLIAVPIGLYLLYQLWNDRKRPLPSLLKVSLFSASGLAFLLIQGGTITDAVFCYQNPQPIPTTTTTEQTVTQVSQNPIPQVLGDSSLAPILDLIKPRWEPNPGYEGRTFESREWERVRLDKPSNTFTVLLDWGIGLFIYPVVLLYMIYRRSAFVSLILGVGLLSLIFPFVATTAWAGLDNSRFAVLPIWLGGALSVIPMRAAWQSNRARPVKRMVVCGFVVLMILTGTSYLLIWATMPTTPSTVMAPIDYEVREEWLGKLDPFQERVFSPSFDVVTGHARAMMVFGTYGSRENGYNDPNMTELGIIAWHQFGLAGDLKASGYSYLYVDENWLSDNFSQQRALLENPNQYELIKTWNDPDTGDVRLLYRLVGTSNASFVNQLPPLYRRHLFPLR